jgi:hypothetical protein
VQKREANLPHHTCHTSPRIALKPILCIIHFDIIISNFEPNQCIARLLYLDTFKLRSTIALLPVRTYPQLALTPHQQVVLPKLPVVLVY